MEKDNYGKQTWVFRIQSPEDFYNQLRAAHRDDANREAEIDTTNLTLAKEMLEKIGIVVK
jgi:hypothetical protein